MNKIKLSLLLMFVVAVLTGCKTQDLVDPKNDLNNFSEIESTQLDLREFDYAPNQIAPVHFIVDLEIQEESYPFIVDTGDNKGTLKISNRLLSRLKNSPTDESRSSKDIYGNTFNNIQYRIPDVKLGDFHFKELQCEVSNDEWFSPFSNYEEYIGMIGWGLLREFNFLFDFKNSRIVLYKRSIVPDSVKDWNSAEFFESNRILSIKGDIGDKKYNFILDSGGGAFTQTLDNKPVILDSLFTKKYKKLLRSLDPVTENIKSPYIYTDFVLGDYTIEGVKFGETAAPWFLTYKYSGFLGWSFFRENTLFFDNENMRLYIK